MTPQWISRELTLTVTGWADRTLRRNDALGKVESRATSEVQRNGQASREYKTASLPANAQRRLQKQFTVKATSSASPEGSTAPPSGQQPLALLPPSSRLLHMPAAPRIAAPIGDATAQQRHEAISPMLDFRAAPERFRERGVTLAMVATQISEQRKVPERTLFRWYGKFVRGGLPAIAGRSRRDKDQSRWATQHEDLGVLAAHLWLNEGRQSVKAVQRDLQTYCETEGIAAPLPSYNTLNNYLARIPDNFRLLARDGRRAYEAKCARFVTRDYDSVQSGQIYVSDHMVHDVYVQNDIFGECDRRFLRLRLTMLMDFRSRRPVGYAWSEEGSSRSIVTALRRCFQRFGPCQFFYCDNGKDYKKVAAGARVESYSSNFLMRDVPPEAHGVLSRLGIRAIHCIPRHPQSKHVEREFGTIHNHFDKLFKTYTGKDAVDVPDAAQAALARHGKLLKAGRVEDSDLPLASNFITACAKWIEEEYVHMPHSGRGMDGGTPAQVWNDERWNAQPECPPMDDLAVLLAERETRMVRNDQVVIDKREYVPADPESSAALHLANGRNVEIAFDPCDPAIAVALDDGGHRIAWLRQKQLAGMYCLQDSAAAEKSRELIADSMAERRRLAKATRGGLEAISRAAHEMGHISQAERMMQRASLPAAVGDMITDRPAKMRPAANFHNAPKSAAQIAREFSEDF